MRSLVRLMLAGVLGGILLTGCAGYRLGATQDLPYRSVAVVMFKNQTLKPQLEAQVTDAILRRFQSDGTLRVEPAGRADVVVTGELLKFKRQQLRTQKSDNSTPREYRETIIARITARDRSTGQLIFPVTDVEGSAETFVGDDLQSADEQALPLIADDLAKRVVTLLAERW